MGRVGTVQDRRWACVGWSHVSEGVQMAAVVWEREDGWLGWCKVQATGPRVYTWYNCMYFFPWGLG